MEKEKYTEKLAKYILVAAAICLIGAVCWYFRSILMYILVSVVVSLISKPIMSMLRKIRIRGHKAPDWLLAALTLTTVMAVALLTITSIVPVVNNILRNISLANVEESVRSIAMPLANLNEFIRETFPRVGNDFRLEVTMFHELNKLLDMGMFSNVLGSAASFLSSLGVGLFSVVFISFFFIKDDGLFTDMVTALVPDKHEKNASEALSDIGHLLSRYFGGVILEIAGVTIVNFIGLLLIARLGFSASIAIAFMTGIFNVIPYVGPLMGGALGTILGLVMKYSSAAPIGLDVSFWAFTAILIAIFCFAQLMDNFLYQPLIYSTSIRAKPLEIFIVLLIVGHMGGPLSMMIAIPCYTVVRVIAFRFFGNIKAIRRLIPDEKLIKTR